MLYRRKSLNKKNRISDPAMAYNIFSHFDQLRGDSSDKIYQDEKMKSPKSPEHFHFFWQDTAFILYLSHKIQMWLILGKFIWNTSSSIPNARSQILNTSFPKSNKPNFNFCCIDAWQLLLQIYVLLLDLFCANIKFWSFVVRSLQNEMAPHCIELICSVIPERRLWYWFFWHPCKSVIDLS